MSRAFRQVVYLDEFRSLRNPATGIGHNLLSLARAESNVIRPINHRVIARLKSMYLEQGIDLETVSGPPPPPAVMPPFAVASTSSAAESPALPSISEAGVPSLPTVQINMIDDKEVTIQVAQLC
mmetsp:Transcript_4565/g.8402  ORF Transcript_4565/g.8402 Transcript_4565/m.8402 type:complete len:124 (+) Transcript_4565:239-610(+)